MYHTIEGICRQWIIDSTINRSMSSQMNNSKEIQLGHQINQDLMPIDRSRWKVISSTIIHSSYNNNKTNNLKTFRLEIHNLRNLHLWLTTLDFQLLKRDITINQLRWLKYTSMATSIQEEEALITYHNRMEKSMKYIRKKKVSWSKMLICLRNKDI